MLHHLKYKFGDVGFKYFNLRLQTNASQSKYFPSHSLSVSALS